MNRREIGQEPIYRNIGRFACATRKGWAPKVPLETHN